MKLATCFSALCVLSAADFALGVRGLGNLWCEPPGHRTNCPVVPLNRIMFDRVCNGGRGRGNEPCPAARKGAMCPWNNDIFCW